MGGLGLQMYLNAEGDYDVRLGYGDTQLLI